MCWSIKHHHYYKIIVTAVTVGELLKFPRIIISTPKNCAHHPLTKKYNCFFCHNRKRYVLYTTDVFLEASAQCLVASCPLLSLRNMCTVICPAERASCCLLLSIKDLQSVRKVQQRFPWPSSPSQRPAWDSALWEMVLVPRFYSKSFFLRADYHPKSCFKTVPHFRFFLCVSKITPLAYSVILLVVTT